MLICSCNWTAKEHLWAVLGWGEMTGEEKWATNESHELKKRDKMMKRAVCHQQAWVGCRRRKREGWKGRVRLGQPFCWSPKQINQGPLEHTNWITQMGLGLGGWYIHSKAATTQRPGWADHSFRHFVKLIIHTGPSLLFFYSLIYPSLLLCLSLFNSSFHLFLR